MKHSLPPFPPLLRTATLPRAHSSAPTLHTHSLCETEAAGEGLLILTGVLVGKQFSP